jgi:predicted flavoprotein YhiN
MLNSYALYALYPFNGYRDVTIRELTPFFSIGEVVDVTGWLGGYNFQWAWSSGWVAGQFT